MTPVGQHRKQDPSKSSFRWAQTSRCLQRADWEGSFHLNCLSSARISCPQG